MDMSSEMKKLLVTGSGGLIGSEVSRYFHDLDWTVVGIDNDQRKALFGEAASTASTVDQLLQLRGYIHGDYDIRDRSCMNHVVELHKPDAIVHCAAQPSHDKAASIPFVDFDINAVGTLNLLEACRQYCPESPFVFLSTNKVYGHIPNLLGVWEDETRFNGAEVDEQCPIDQCLHSLFGASKLAADIMVQEYGRYFSMPTCCLRGGCLTGPAHAGVELHGFLSYLIKCAATGTPYTVHGHGGKQVRDNIHSLDVARFIHKFIKAPRSAEVYNIGGGYANSISVIEAIEKAEAVTGKKMDVTFGTTARKGDHIHYISDLTKCQAHYSDWSVTIGLDEIFEQIHVAQTHLNK
jgi:CDP-paratose 2-epimerase